MHQESAIAHGPGAELHKDLKQRHLTMIAEERSAWLRQDIVERAKSKYDVLVRDIVLHAPVEIFGT